MSDNNKLFIGYSPTDFFYESANYINFNTTSNNTPLDISLNIANKDENSHLKLIKKQIYSSNDNVPILTSATNKSQLFYDTKGILKLRYTGGHWDNTDPNSGILDPNYVFNTDKEIFQLKTDSKSTPLKNLTLGFNGNRIECKTNSTVYWSSSQPNTSVDASYVAIEEKYDTANIILCDASGKLLHNISGNKGTKSYDINNKVNAVKDMEAKHNTASELYLDANTSYNMQYINRLNLGIGIIIAVGYIVYLVKNPKIVLGTAN